MPRFLIIQQTLSRMALYALTAAGLFVGIDWFCGPVSELLAKLGVHSAFLTVAAAVPLYLLCGAATLVGTRKLAAVAPFPNYGFGQKPVFATFYTALLAVSWPMALSALPLLLLALYLPPRVVRLKAFCGRYVCYVPTRGAAGASEVREYAPEQFRPVAAVVPGDTPTHR